MSDLTAVDVLRNHQKQCDFDGTEVQVSRQALDEVLDRIESLEADHEKAVALVIAASIATGHADTSADLMAEVLHKVGELRHALETTQQAKKNNELLMGGLGAANTGLRAENAALREKSRILAGRIGCGCGGDYGLCAECSSALDAPPTTDKEEQK